MAFIVRGLALVAALLVSLEAASADQYVYQGNPFDTFDAFTETSQFTTANAVVFSFVTVSAIPDNTTFDLDNVVAGNFVLSPNVTSWSITDGTFSYGSSSVDASLIDSFVTTDSSGAISSWQIVAELIPSSTIVTCGAAPCQESVGHTTWYAGEYDQVNNLSELA